MDRRTFLGAGIGAVALGAGRIRPALAQTALPELPPAQEPYARLQGGTPHHLTPDQEAQRVVDSPAPPGPPGRWTSRATLPIPRSEMAWATVAEGRMHIVGGYGEGAVNRPYHHIYDPAVDRWYQGAGLPRGANHVAVAADRKSVV